MKWPLLILLSLLFPVWVHADSVKEAADSSEDTFVYDSRGKKDPFAPGDPVWTEARTAMRLKESHLEGVVWDQSNPLVILDGKILKKGDTFLKARVTGVEKDRADFTVGEETITVFVKKKSEQNASHE